MKITLLAAKALLPEHLPHPRHHRNSSSCRHLSEQDWNFQSPTSAQLLLPKGLLRATLVPLFWGLTWSELRTTCWSGIQSPSQATWAWFSFSRPLHLKGLTCFQGSSLPWKAFVQKFRPFHWDAAELWKAGCQVCQQSWQIPTPGLLPSAIPACYSNTFPNRNGNSGKKKFILQTTQKVSVSENGWQQQKLPTSLIAPLKF